VRRSPTSSSVNPKPKCEKRLTVCTGDADQPIWHVILGAGDQDHDAVAEGNRGYLVDVTLVSVDATKPFDEMAGS